MKQSKNETAGSPEQTAHQFSELFPLSLYLNREGTQTYQLSYDIAAAPKIGKDAENDDYDRMPIEDFGKSVLSKLGWQEGKAIGRTNMQNGAQVTQPIEYIPRQHRLGLGAKPLTKEQLKKMDKEGFDQDALRRKMNITEEYELGASSTGGKNFKSIHDKL